MPQAVARFIDQRPTRLAVIVVCSALTVLLAPMLAVGLIDGALNLRSEGWRSVFVVACGGLLGIVSAWVRVLIGGQRLRRLPALRWSICGGLTVGVVVATFLVADFLALGWGPQSANPVPMAYFFAGIVGVFLLAGTAWLQHQPAI